MKFDYWKKIIEQWCKESGTDRYEITVVAEWAIATGLWNKEPDKLKMAQAEIKRFIKSYRDDNGVEFMISVRFGQQDFWEDRRTADFEFRQKHLSQEVDRVMNHHDKIKKKWEVMRTEQPPHETPLQLNFPWSLN